MDNTTETVIENFADAEEVIEGVVEAPEEPSEELGNISVPKEVIDILSAAPSGVEILTECIDTAVFLCQKNGSYGDSALDPIRIFSKADSIEQIKVRIDDKLSRLTKGTGHPGDNDTLDLLGYLILLRVAEKRAE